MFVGLFAAASYLGGSCIETLQWQECIKPVALFCRHSFWLRVLSGLKLIPLRRRRFRPTSASRKSARRLANSCAVPYQCYRVTALSNGGPPALPTPNRMAGASSNADRFRPRVARFLMSPITHPNRRRQRVSHGRIIVTAKMVFGSIESWVIK